MTLAQISKGLPFGTRCELVQDDDAGEPMVLLRRRPLAQIEVLTVQQAHEVLEGHVGKEGDWDNDQYWWYELDDLLEGIR